MKLKRWLMFMVCAIVVSLLASTGLRWVRWSSQLAYIRKTTKGNQAVLRHPLGWSSDISKKFGVVGIFDGSLAWSPNGLHLAYFAGFADSDRNFVCDVDVKAQQLSRYPLSEGCHPESLIWSPEGDAVLLLCQSRNDDAEPTIWRIDLSTSDLMMIAHLPTTTRHIDWSPDRTRVVATLSSQEGVDRIVILNLVTGEQRDIYVHALWDWAVWSPNGAAIAFTRFEGDDGKGSQVSLCFYDLDTDSLQCPVKQAYHPVWSHSGTAVAFVYHEHSAGSWLAQTSLTGSQHELLVELKPYWTGDSRIVRAMAWSEDDRFLAYESCRLWENSRSCSIRIVRHDGKLDRPISVLRFAGQTNPVWRPRR